MTVIVGFVSQKGGTGKSTLARALAAVVAHAGLKVKIADVDPQQQTIVEWHKVRDENRVAPALVVRGFRTVAEAIKAAEPDELLILDTPAGATRRILEVARAADLIVQPSGGGVDDLRPAVVLFNDLVQSGVPADRLVVALCRTLGTAEETGARAYIKKARYEVLAGSVPERLGYREAHNRGAALTETKRSLNEQAKDLMAALFAKVVSQLEKREKHGVRQKS